MREKKATAFFSGGGTGGRSPLCPSRFEERSDEQDASWRPGPQKPFFCCNLRCAEDGICRRQGVDLITPCTSDTSSCA